MTAIPFLWQLFVFLSGTSLYNDHTPGTRCFLRFHRLHSYQPSLHRSDQYCYSPDLQHTGHNLREQ